MGLINSCRRRSGKLKMQRANYVPLENADNKDSAVEISGNAEAIDSTPKMTQVADSAGKCTVEKDSTTKIETDLRNLSPFVSKEDLDSAIESAERGTTEIIRRSVNGTDYTTVMMMKNSATEIIQDDDSSKMQRTEDSAAIERDKDKNSGAAKNGELFTDSPINCNTGECVSLNGQETMPQNLQKKAPNKKVSKTSKKTPVPAPRIPWLPVQFGSTPFVKTKFFKLISNKAEDKGNAVANLYRIWNRIFPNYLPARYYSMNCTSMFEDSDTNKMWASITHLLLSNQRHGALIWSPFKFFPHYAKDMTPNTCDATNDQLQRNQELCGSAEEFLFEPWVLVQLPFHSVILHQWLVAALAESLKFEKSVAEFFKLRVSECFINVIGDLHKLLSKLKLGLDKCFEFLSASLYYSSGDANYQNVCKSIEEILPILKFVMSKQFKDMVKSLKRMIWIEQEDSGSSLNVNLERCVLPRDYIYSIEYWKDIASASVFGPSEASGKAKGKQDQEKILQFFSWLKPNVSEEDLWEFTKNNNFIDCVKIPFDTKEVSAACYTRLLLRYGKYNYYSDVKNSFAAVPEQEFGVIANILILQAEVHMMESLLEMIDHYCLLNNKRPKFVNVEGPDLELKDIKNAFLDSLKCSEQWKLSSILEMLSLELDQIDQNQTLEFPALVAPNLQMGLLKIAQLFEVRIKRLVLKMAKSCLGSVKQSKVTLCPDWLLVQYLLPCLVVCLLDMEKDMNFESNHKEFFVQFVHNVLWSYEEYPLWTEKEKLANSDEWEAMDSANLTAPCAGSREKWKKISQLFPVPVMSKLDKFNTCMMTLCDFGCNGTYCLNVQQLMWRFICRMQFVLDKQVGKLPTSEENTETLQLICRVLSGISYHECYYKDKTSEEPPKATATDLAAEIFGFCSKMEEVSLHRLKRIKPGAFENPKEYFVEESEQLTQQQLFGIIIHMFMNFRRISPVHTFEEKRENMVKPCAFDLAEIAYFSYVHNDLWRLQQITSSLLRNKEGENLSLVSNQFALEKAPVCYSIAMHEISRKKKVKMSHPGQYTFCPIVHCRWCGLIECEEFRVCKLCQEEPNYPDRNIFCSPDCEEMAVEKQHLEEHAKYLMLQCGIDI